MILQEAKSLQDGMCLQAPAVLVIINSALSRQQVSGVYTSVHEATSYEQHLLMMVSRKVSTSSLS